MKQSYRPSRERPANIETPDSNEELDIRLKRQIFLSSQAQKELFFARSQAEYCSSFLLALREEHEKIKKHELLSRSNPFGSWQGKLKQLSLSALTIQSQENPHFLQENKKKQVLNKECSQKKHLMEIFQKDSDSAEVDQIRVLEQRLSKIYSQISSLVMEEYLNDKVFLKIKREARRASKQKTLHYLFEEIDKHKDWVQQRQSKVENEMTGKQVEEKIRHNLEMMKLIMNKKVINNDFIYEQFEEKREQTQRSIDRLLSLPVEIETQYQASINFFQTKFVQSQAQSKSIQNRPKLSTPKSTLDFKLINNYLNQVSQTLEQLDTYHQERTINDKCQILSQKLDSLWSSLKR